MEMFMGYRRKNDTVGTRNYVGILSAVVCANEVVEAIVRQVEGTARFTHHQGCCQTPLDIRLVNRALIGLGGNPNLHSVILISLGCESTNLSEVVEGIRASGKRVEHLIIQETGGAARTTAAGILLAQEMVSEASHQQREPFPISKLLLGMKCGSSDTTSGLVPNPAIGVASDLLVAAGGTSILGEVTEFIGAEHILARHAVNKEVAQGIFDLVKRMEKRAMAVGEDIRGGQPTGGNIKGGLTTIEEKSLGAIAKAGTAPIQAVYEYGVRPSVQGLVSDGFTRPRTGDSHWFSRRRVQCDCFCHRKGSAARVPFVPVLKITGSRTAAEKMSDHIDMNLSEVIDGEDTIPDAGRRVLDELIQIASGAMTKAEISGYTNSMDIYMQGPVI